MRALLDRGETARQIGAVGTTRAVSLQVAASAAGSFARPAGLGVAIEALGPRILALLLLVLGLAMCGVYGHLRHVGRSHTDVSPDGSRSRGNSRDPSVRRAGDRQVPVRHAAGTLREVIRAFARRLRRY